jgi:hypothetical protein
MSATRVMTTCMATGEAAGVAAAMAADGVPPRRIDARVVREQLLRQGAQLDV